MSLISDTKTFLRDMVQALEVAVERIAHVADPTKRVVLTSRLMGSCDTLITVLVFLGESVPQIRRFTVGGKRAIGNVRAAANRLRADAWQELNRVDQPEDGDESQVQSDRGQASSYPAGPTSDGG